MTFPADGGEKFVARASRPLWHGPPFAPLKASFARAYLRLVLTVDKPHFPGVKGNFMAAGARRSCHSGRDARATNFSPPSGGEAKTSKFYVVHLIRARRYAN